MHSHWELGSSAYYIRKDSWFLLVACGRVRQEGGGLQSYKATLLPTWSPRLCVIQICPGPGGIAGCQRYTVNHSIITLFETEPVPQLVARWGASTTPTRSGAFGRAWPTTFRRHGRVRSSSFFPAVALNQILCSDLYGCGHPRRSLPLDPLRTRDAP